MFTTIDRIISSYRREYKKDVLSDSDIIELVGDVLYLLKLYIPNKESVTFLDVKDFHANLPSDFNTILQVAKYNGNDYVEDNYSDCGCEKEKEEEEKEEEVINRKKEIRECKKCNKKKDNTVVSNVDMQYIDWIYSPQYKEGFTPIRLSNHTFFNSVVCREKEYDSIYKDCTDEYTIVGTVEPKLRFSFRNGVVALAYIKNLLDDNGYPYIPDEQNLISAITYYLKWKSEESEMSSNREGSGQLVEYYNKMWNKYAGMAKNYNKMPKTLDDLQDIAEMGVNIIPNINKYYDFFGPLGRRQTKIK